MSLDRRDFLTIGALIAAGTAMGAVGPALSHVGKKHKKKAPMQDAQTDQNSGTDNSAPAANELRPVEDETGTVKLTDNNSWGMVIDIDKCGDGCTACIDACHVENNVPSFGDPKLDAHWIRQIKFKQRGVEGAKERTMPAMCFHCEHPPCAHVCPVAATFKRDDGIVLVDKHRCIGCRYCMIACPYKARSFVFKKVEHKPGDNPDVPIRMKGVVEKCTLCVHRIDGGIEPACVEACKKEGNGAMDFGDFNDKGSSVLKSVKSSKAKQIRADLGTNPRVFYLGI